MESNILNPKYKELKAIEMYRNNSTGMDYHEEHKNNWKKSLISIFAIAVLLTSIGVPVYSGLISMENNAIPYEFGNLGKTIQSSSTDVITSGHIAELVDYELTHWGARPTETDIVNFLIGLFIGVGIVVGSGTLATIGFAILWSSWSNVAIIGILALDLSNPVGQALLGSLAIAIVAY